MIFIFKEELLDAYKMKLNLLSDGLDMGMQNILKDKNHTLGISCAKLQAISPLNTLARGYSMVQNECGEIISTVDKIKKNDVLNISFADGGINAVVKDIKLGGRKNA